MAPMVAPACGAISPPRFAANGSRYCIAVSTRASPGGDVRNYPAGNHLHGKLLHISAGA